MQIPEEASLPEGKDTRPQEGSRRQRNPDSLSTKSDSHRGTSPSMHCRRLTLSNLHSPINVVSSVK